MKKQPQLFSEQPNTPPPEQSAMPLPLTLFDGMNVPNDLLNDLLGEYGVSYAEAQENEDYFTMGVITGRASRDLYTMLRSGKYGIYDEISRRVFNPTKKATLGALLYRHYFTRYPSAEHRTEIDAAIDRYGLSTVSEAMSFWRTMHYNPTNLAGMMSTAKRTYDANNGFFGIVQKELDDIFKGGEE